MDPERPGGPTPLGHAHLRTTWHTMADPTAEQTRRRAAASRVAAALSRDAIDIAAAAQAVGGHTALLERLSLLLAQRVARMPQGTGADARARFVRWLDGRHPARDVIASVHRIVVHAALSHAPAARVAKVALASLLAVVRQLQHHPDLWASVPRAGQARDADDAPGCGLSAPQGVPTAPVAGLVLRPGGASRAMEPCPAYRGMTLAQLLFMAVRGVLDLEWSGAWSDGRGVREVLALRGLWVPLFEILPAAADALRAAHGFDVAARVRDEWVAAVGALARVGSTTSESTSLLAGIDPSSPMPSRGFVDVALALADKVLQRKPATPQDASTDLLTAASLAEATLVCIVSCLSFNKALVTCFERNLVGYNVVRTLLRRLGDGYNAKPHADVTLQQLKQAVYLPLVLLAVSGAPTLTARAVEDFVLSSSDVLDVPPAADTAAGPTRDAWQARDDLGFDSPGSMSASDDASPASPASPASFERGGHRSATSDNSSELSDSSGDDTDPAGRDARDYTILHESIKQPEEVRNISALDATLPWCNPHAFCLLVQAFKDCVVDFELRNLLLKGLLFALTKFLRQYLHRSDADALWGYAPVEAVSAVYHTDLDAGMQRSFLSCALGLVCYALSKGGGGDVGPSPPGPASPPAHQHAVRVFTDALVYDLTCVVRLLRPPVSARLMTMAQDGCGRWFVEGMERVLSLIAKIQRTPGARACEVLRRAKLCETVAELLHSGFGWNNVAFISALLGVIHTQCKRDRQSVRHILTHCHQFLHDVYALMVYLPPQSPSTFVHFRAASSLLFLFSPEHDVIKELLTVLKVAPLSVAPHDAIALLSDIPCPHCHAASAAATPKQQPSMLPRPLHDVGWSPVATPAPDATATATPASGPLAGAGASPYDTRPRLGASRAERLERERASGPAAHLPDPMAACPEVSERTCMHRQHPHIRRAEPPEVVLAPDAPLKRAVLRRKIALALIKLLHKTPTAASDFLQGRGFALLADACEQDAAEAGELCTTMIRHNQCRDGQFVGLPPGTSPIDAVSENASWFDRSESGLTGGPEGRDILWHLHGNLLTYMAAATEAATRTGAAGCAALEESQFGARVIAALEKMCQPHLPGSTILLALGLLRVGIHATCLPLPDEVCIPAILRHHKLPTTIVVPLLPSDQHHVWAVYHPKIILAALRLTRPTSAGSPDAWWVCASVLHRHVLDTVRKIVEATVHNVVELDQANFIGEILDATVPLLQARRDEALCDSVFNVVRSVGRTRVATKHLHPLLQHCSHPFLGRWCADTLRDWAEKDNPVDCGPHHYLSFPCFKDDHNAPDQNSVAILPRLCVTPWVCPNRGYTTSMWARFEPMECNVGSLNRCYVLMSSHAHTEDGAVLVTEVCLNRTGTGSADRRLFCRVAMAEEPGDSNTLYYNAYVPSLRELKPYKWYHIAITHVVEVRGDQVEHTFDIRLNGGIKHGMEGVARVAVPGREKFKKMAKRGGKLNCMVLGASLIDYLFSKPAAGARGGDASGSLAGAVPTTHRIAQLFRSGSGAAEELYQGGVEGFASVQLGSIAVLWGGLSEWQAYLLYCLSRDYCGDFNEPLVNYHCHGVLAEGVCYPHKGWRGDEGRGLQEAAASWLSSAIGLAEGIPPTAGDGLHDRLIMLVSARAGGYNAFVASRVVSTTSAAIAQEGLHRKANPRATPQLQPVPGTPTPMPSDLSRASDDDDMDSSSALGLLDDSRRGSTRAPAGAAVPLIRVQADTKITLSAAPVDLYGAATCMANVTLKSLLRSVGGMASIVSLVSLAPNHAARVAAVHLLGDLMQHSPENTQTMSADGYSALAWYLKKVRVTVDHALLDACFRLAGVEADASGVLQDVHALKLVLMDWGIWSRGGIAVQRELIFRLDTLVSNHNLGRAHRSVLIHAGIVPWMLNHTLPQTSEPVPFDIRIRPQVLGLLHSMCGATIPRQQVGHRLPSRAPCLLALTLLLRYFIATARRSVAAFMELTAEERSWRRGFLKLFVVLLSRVDDADLPAVLRSTKTSDLSGPDVFLGLLADPCPRTRLLVLVCINWFLQQPSTRAYFSPEAVVSQYSVIAQRGAEKTSSAGGGAVEAAPVPLDALEPSVSELQLLLLMLLHRPRRGGGGGGSGNGSAVNTPTTQPLTPGGVTVQGLVRQPALPAIFLQTVGAHAPPLQHVPDADAAALAHAAHELAAAALQDPPLTSRTPRHGGGTATSTPHRTPTHFASAPPPFTQQEGLGRQRPAADAVPPSCFSGESKTAHIFHAPETLEDCTTAAATEVADEYGSPGSDDMELSGAQASLHEALQGLQQLVECGRVPGTDGGDECTALRGHGTSLGRPFGVAAATASPAAMFAQTHADAADVGRRRAGTALRDSGTLSFSSVEAPVAYRELALPLLRPLLLLVETTLSPDPKRRPDMPPLCAAHLRFKRAMVIDALHTVFKHGAPGLKLKFLERDARVGDDGHDRSFATLLVRLFLPRVAAGDTDFAAMVLALLGDIVAWGVVDLPEATDRSADVDPMGVLESTLTAIYSLSTALTDPASPHHQAGLPALAVTRWVYHLQHHVLHLTLLRFRKRFLEPEARASQSLLARFVGFSEMCVDTVQSWRFMKRSAGDAKGPPVGGIGSSVGGASTTGAMSPHPHSPESMSSQQPSLAAFGQLSPAHDGLRGSGNRWAGYAVAPPRPPGAAGDAPTGLGGRAHSLDLNRKMHPQRSQTMIPPQVGGSAADLLPLRYTASAVDHVDAEIYVTPRNRRGGGAGASQVTSPSASPAQTSDANAAPVSFSVSVSPPPTAPSMSQEASPAALIPSEGSAEGDRPQAAQQPVARKFSEAPPETAGADAATTDHDDGDTHTWQDTTLSPSADTEKTPPMPAAQTDKDHVGQGAARCESELTIATLTADSGDCGIALTRMTTANRSRANALSMVEGSTTQEARVTSPSVSHGGLHSSVLPPQLVWLLPPLAPPNPSEWLAGGEYASVSPSVERKHSYGSQSPVMRPAEATPARDSQYGGDGGQNGQSVARRLHDEEEAWDVLSENGHAGEAGGNGQGGAAVAPPEEVRSFLFWLLDTIRTSVATAATLQAGRPNNRLLRKMNRSKLPKESLTLQLKRLLLELLALPSSKVAHPLLPAPEAAIGFALATLISCQVSDQDSDAKQGGGPGGGSGQAGWCAKLWPPMAQEVHANSLLASLTKKDEDPGFVEQVLYHTSPRLRVARGLEAANVRKVWKYLLEGREHSVRKIFDPSVLPGPAGAQSGMPGGCILFALILTMPCDRPQIDTRYTHPTTSSEDRLFSSAFVASGMQTRLKEGNKIAKRLEDKAVRTVLVEHPRSPAVNYTALDARTQRVMKDFEKFIRHTRQRKKDARGVVGRLVRSRVMLQGLWGAAAAVYTRIPMESMHLNWRLDDVEGPDRVRVRLKRFLALPLVEELGLVEGHDDDASSSSAAKATANNTSGPAGALSAPALPPLHPGPPSGSVSPADAGVLDTAAPGVVNNTSMHSSTASAVDIRKALSQNRPSTASFSSRPDAAERSATHVSDGSAGAVSPQDDDADDEIQALIDHQFEPGMAGPEEDMDDVAHTRQYERYPCSQVTPMVRVEGELVFYAKALYYVSHDSPYRDDLAKVDQESDEESEEDMESGDGARAVTAPESPRTIRARSREIAERMKERERARKKKMVHRMHLHAVRHRVTAWYSEISGVFRRRYLLVNNSLEFFTERGLAFFFSFESEAVRERVFHAILNRCPRAREMSPSAENLKRWRDRWQKGELTNFQYLMLLNTMSGRSFNDLTQYPIFPHVIADYESEELDLNDPKSYRDFSKPMGVQTEDRRLRCEMKYQQTAEMHEMLKVEMGDQKNSKESGGFSSGLRTTLTQLGFGWMMGKGKEDKDYTDIDLMALPPYHHGTHFSNRATVLYYCIRLQPFADYFCELNDLKLDVPDRSFHSMLRAWRLSSAISSSDVKELTPEFFSLPDFLVNSNRMVLGVKQDKDKVDHLELPPWAKGDPRLFVAIQRRALEGPWVSSQLHHWINLVFGYKASGPNAVEAFNCFHPYAYEGAVNVDMITDPVKRQSVIDIINNFGQMPQQLLTKRHCKRSVERIYGSRDPSWWQVGRPIKKVCEAPFEKRGADALMLVRVEVRKGVVWSLRAECGSKETATTRAIDTIAQEDADDEVYAATSERRNCILLVHSSFEPGSDLNAVGTKSRAETLSYCSWDNSVRIQPYQDYQTNRNSLILKQSTRSDMILTAATSATDAAHIAFGTENGLVEVYGYAGSSSRSKRYPADGDWRRWEVPDAEPCGFNYVPVDIPERLHRRTAPASTLQFTHDDGDARHRVLRPLAALHGHTAGVVSLVISKEFNIIVSGGLDGRVLVWDLLEFTFIRSMSGIVDGQCAKPVLQSEWCPKTRQPRPTESITLVDANPATGDIIAVSAEKTQQRAAGAYARMVHQLNLWNINGVELSCVKLDGQATCTQFTGTLLAVGLLTGRVLLLSAYDLTPLAAPLCPRLESPITALATNEAQTKLYTSHQQTTPQGTQSVITTWMVTTK